MGLFKFFASVATGGILSPQTTRERSRKYQREANDLLEAQLHAIQDLAQQQTPTDTRQRGKCPECLEMMLIGASTCPHCHTTAITWSTEKNQVPVNTKGGNKPCKKCGGKVHRLSSGKLKCSDCLVRSLRKTSPGFKTPLDGST
jgi:hypothetical protein